MNTGIIASRYALALYKYVSETGNARQADAQVRRLQEVLAATPALQQVLDDPAGVSPEQKKALFESALAPEKLLPELDRFLSMLLENRRLDLVKLVFHDFLSLCDQGEGIVRVRLVTAAPSGTLETRLQKLLQEKTGRGPAGRIPTRIGRPAAGRERAPSAGNHPDRVAGTQPPDCINRCKRYGSEYQTQ